MERNKPRNGPDGRPLEDVLGIPTEEIPRGDEMTALQAERGKGKKRDRSWRSQLAQTKDKRFKSTVANVGIILKNDPAWRDVLAFNERTLQVIWQKPSTICEARAGETLKEFHALNAVIWLSTVYGISVSHSTALETLIAIARGRPFDPLQGWLRPLQWDGVDRLDRWIPDSCGVEATAYTMTIGRKFLISAVARAMAPGCKVDSMLILLGPQGTLKSTLLARLGGDYFSDQIGEIGNKDTLLQIHGPWIVEMSELDSMTKRETTAVKAFLTATVDRFRPPYGRVTEEHPRRCVFAGTTNQETFLKDETGGRRFWPVEINEIDLSYVESNRDQLWAEALHRFNAGEIWWIDRDEVETLRLALEEQEKRRQIDPWEEKIAAIVEGKLYHITTTEILSDMQIDASKQDRFAQIRVGHAMKALGWTRRKVRDGRHFKWVYEPPIRAVDGKDAPASSSGASSDPQGNLGEGY